MLSDLGGAASIALVRMGDPAILQYARMQPFLDQPHHARIRHPVLDESHQPVVFDGVEELRTAGGVMRLWDAAGYLAAGLVITAFCMKGMVPLRIVALTSNVAFLVYGIGLGLVPVWLLHAILLPVNSWRLWQRIARRPTAAAPEARLGQASVVTECEGGGPLLDDEAHDLHSARRPGRCSEPGSSKHDHKPAGINPVT